MTYDEHQSGPRFPRGFFSLRAVLLVALSIGLMSADARFHHLDQIRRVLAAVVYPVHLMVDAPTAVAAWVGDNFRDRQELSQENRQLRRHHRELSVSLQRLAALEAENARLRALMDSTARISDRVLHGEIMSVDLDDRFRHRVLIDRGRLAGAFAGQALVSANGIIGQILRANDMTSEAILISDPSHALPVAVNRTGLLTVAYGTGDAERLDLPYVPKSADLQPGDLLVSSGLGGSFPAGYPVARITSVNHEREKPFATVTAVPTAHLNRVRELLLVWSHEDAAPPAMVVDGDEEPASGASSAANTALTASTLAE